MGPDHFGYTTAQHDADVCILLASGKEWRPFRPSADDFEWTDIAIGAARIPRFGGQLAPKVLVSTSENYVLAQHLCLAFDLAVANDVTDAEVLLAVLLHDAEEPLGGLGDPVGPVKHAPFFRDALKAYYAPIIDCIADKAGINRALLHGDKRVKTWDKAAYRVENWHLRGLRDDAVPSLPPRHRRRLHQEMAVWHTLHAYGSFLDRLDKAFSLLAHQM